MTENKNESCFNLVFAGGGVRKINWDKVAGSHSVSATTQCTRTNAEGPAAWFRHRHSCKCCPGEAGGERQVGWNGLGQQDVHHR